MGMGRVFSIFFIENSLEKLSTAELVSSVLETNHSKLSLTPMLLVRISLNLF